MASKVLTNINTELKTKQLQAILYLLQTHLEDLKKEVDRSYELLKIGELTDLSKKIENTLNSPFGNILEISKDIDDKVKQVLNSFVSSFFKYRHDLIQAVFKSKTPLDELYYSIVLREDNLENRNKIFEFYNKFDLLDISNRYPVYFQFVPKELLGKIKYIEEIKIE